MEFPVGQIDIPTVYPTLAEHKPKVKPKPKTQNYNPYNCVSYVNWRTGGKVVKGIGTAKNHPINSLIPAEGAIVVLDYKPLGHLAYVEKVSAETITISECNALYPNGPCGSREINKNDSSIKGYFYVH